VPYLDGETDMTAQVKVLFFHSTGNREWKSKKVECKQQMDILANPVWDETFEFEYTDEDLVFIRFVSFYFALQSPFNTKIFARFVIQDVGYIDTDAIAVFCARVKHLENAHRDSGAEWRIARLFGTKGELLNAALLLKVEFE
jgi:hypothetical protein